MTGAHINKAHGIVDSIDAIGRYFPQFRKGEVMVKRLPRLLFRPVFTAVILEVSLYISFFFVSTEITGSPVSNCIFLKLSVV
jgi:hypothetical protein